MQSGKRDCSRLYNEEEKNKDTIHQLSVSKACDHYMATSMGRVLGAEDVMKSLGCFCSTDREKPPPQMTPVGLLSAEDPGDTSASHCLMQPISF